MPFYRAGTPLEQSNIYDDEIDAIPLYGPSVFGEHAGKPQSLCQWPHCDHFAVVETKWHLRGSFVALCYGHRRRTDLLRLEEIDEMSWQPRRRRRIADEPENWVLDDWQGGGE